MTYSRPRESQWVIHPDGDQSGKSEAMENLDPGEKAEKTQISVIGADILITGNIEASVDLHIEGRVRGDVHCATLILGENSSVNGSIYANRVRVAGTVEGAIETRDLAVEATARVTGDILYERLRVASGGSIEGNMKRRPASEAGPGGKMDLLEPEPDLEPPAQTKRIVIE